MNFYQETLRKVLDMRRSTLTEEVLGRHQTETDFPCNLRDQANGKLYIPSPKNSQ